MLGHAADNCSYEASAANACTGTKPINITNARKTLNIRIKKSRITSVLRGIYLIAAARRSTQKLYEMIILYLSPSVKFLPQRTQRAPAPSARGLLLCLDFLLLSRAESSCHAKAEAAIPFPLSPPPPVGQGFSYPPHQGEGHRGLDSRRLGGQARRGDNGHRLLLVG